VPVLDPAAPRVERGRQHGPPTRLGRASVVRLRYDGANAQSELRPGVPLPGVVNYLTGSDPRAWLTNLPTYESLSYVQLYPASTCATTASTASSSAPTWWLLVPTPARSAGATRAPAMCAWTRRPATWRLRSRHRHSACREPACANVPPDRLAGDRWPACARRHTLRGTCSGDPCEDVVVAKLNAAGSAVLYSTYMGGNGTDEGIGVAVDSAGLIYPEPEHPDLWPDRHHQQPGGRSVSFGRDGQGRITTVTDPASKSYTYVYSATGDLGSVTLPGVATPIRYGYDTSHLVTATYDADGRLKDETDAVGNKISYGYNLLANTAVITYPDLGVRRETVVRIFRNCSDDFQKVV
jgi:YD repeat-containing protein